MIHHLLLKFKEGCCTEDLYKLTVDTFLKLEAELSDVVSVSVFKNCIFRQSNADLMIVMDLEGEDSLETYLRHPLHFQFVQEIEDCLLTKITFDYCQQ